MAKKTKDIHLTLYDIADTLENIACRLRDIAESELSERTPYRYLTKKVMSNTELISANEAIEHLGKLGRDNAKDKLDSMTHAQLEPIFSMLTSMSGKKKPKEFMINKILWHLFDFSAGHEIVRNSPRSEK